MDDITKKPAYVWTELSVRIASALAIVTLGIAGWRLQQADQKSRRLESERRQIQDDNQVAARRYLPMLRSLTELEVALDHCASGLRAPSAVVGFSRPEVGGEPLRRAAEMLRHFAQSVFVPDGDPEVAVRSSAGSALPRVKLPLRSAALMLSDIMRIKAYLSAPRCQQCSASLDNESLTLKGAQDPIAVKFYLTPDALPAWRAWVAASTGHRPLSGKTIPVESILPVTTAQMIHDLEFGVADVVHATVVKHVEIADQYVTVRNQVVTDSRNPIFEFNANDVLTAPTTTR
ncbi:MAG: hypothetical protein QOC81_1720 [Thermoanaerobaculia bacterium]|nr:hypothetical protein [Thermoanaerobaculia bacterium]